VNKRGEGQHETEVITGKSAELPASEAHAEIGGFRMPWPIPAWDSAIG
jgi:hypothetical protein